MSGQWPPGWEDPEDSEQEAAGLDAETDIRLSEVTAFLAAVPAPVLPDAIESRILAAIAVESAALAAQSTSPASDSAAPAPEPEDLHILRPRPAQRARLRRTKRDRVRRFPRINPALAAWPVAACLFFAGVGYLVSTTGSSSSSSMPMPAAAASSAAASGAGPQMGYSSASSGSAATGVVGTPSFALVRSGTDYRAATLAAQVRSVIVATAKRTNAAVPSATSTSHGSATTAPTSNAPASVAASPNLRLSAITPTLRGCVVHFTGGAPPRLIDRASYQGTPAYVIASDSRVWVVGLGCTAAHPDLIASAPLAS